MIREMILGPLLIGLIRWRLVDLRFDVSDLRIGSFAMLLYSVFGVGSWAVILFLALWVRRLRAECERLSGEVDFAWNCFDDHFAAAVAQTREEAKRVESITVDLDVA